MTRTSTRTLNADNRIEDLQRTSTKYYLFNRIDSMVFPWFFHVTISHHQGSSHKHVEIPQLMSPGAHGRVTLPAPESCCVVPGVLLFPASHGETGSDASIIDASQLVVQLVACHRLASIMFSSFVS